MFSRSKLAAAVGLLALCQGAAQAAPAPVVHLASTPKTVIRGVIAADRPAVLTVKSGTTVAIDTISHGGLTEDPVAFFGAAGIPAGQVLKDAVDIAKMGRGEGFGGHVLTGPVYVEGAEPGDLLEVRIRKVESRVPYGVNNAGPGGAAPDLVHDRFSNVIKFDMKRKVAIVVPGKVEIPLAQFQGIMAVAPPPETNRVGSRLPATLYLPVFNPGGLFYTGDSHAAQGDGEVSGNAIEASNTATPQFIVHKGAGKAMRFPYAEDADFYYPLGLDKDLGLAYRYAVEEAVAMLTGMGLTPGEAYSFASTGIDFGVAEDVDGVLVAYGAIPKAALKHKTAYWASPAPRPKAK